MEPTARGVHLWKGHLLRAVATGRDMSPTLCNLIEQGTGINVQTVLSFHPPPISCLCVPLPDPHGKSPSDCPFTVLGGGRGRGSWEPLGWSPP